MNVRPLLLTLLLIPACCPAPKDDTEPAFRGAAAASSLPYALDPEEPPSVEMARDRGAYKGAAQLRVTRLDQRVQETSRRIQDKPAQARALNEAHWALVRAFKAVETSDEATFPETRERFEKAEKDLETLLKQATP